MATRIIADKVGRDTNSTLETEGSLIVGDNNSDRLTVNARINSNITPSANNLYNLGTDALDWNTAYINILHLSTSAGTDGQMLYNSGSGEIGATSEIYTTGTQLGIGNSSPTHTLDIVSELANGTRIRLQQNQGTNADGPDIKFERARGTTASPSNLAADDSIGRFECFSYTSGTSNYTSSGNLGWVSANSDGTGDSIFRLQVKSKDGTGNSLMRTKIETDAGTGGVKIGGDLNPSLDNTYDLGSTSGGTWANLYATNATLETVTADSGGLSFSGDLDFTSATVSSFVVSDLTVLDGVTEKTSNVTGGTGSVTLDCSNGHIFFLDSLTGNITPTFTNVNIGTQGFATATTLVIEQGNPAYAPGTTVSINGTAVTVQWQGGSPPVGTVNGYDAVSYSIMNNSGTLLVLGQLVSFG